MTVKTLIRTLATCLCLLLALPSPGVAGEAPFESLPIGAKARLGRGQIRDAQYSPDGTRLAVGSSVGIWLYDTQTYETTSLLTGHTDAVVSVAFSPDGRTLASVDRDGAIRLWNADTGTLRHTLEGPFVYSLAFRPPASEPHHPRRSLEGPFVYSLAFSPDGRTLASASWPNTTIHLWDAAEGTLRRTLESHSGTIDSLAFSPDGRILATGNTEGTVHLWDVTTDTLLHILKSQTDEISSVTFSPDGRTLASGSWDDTIQLWDPDTGTLRHTLEGHSGSILSLAFSPDGRTLVSGSVDNTARLWDAAEGTLRRTLEGHSDGIPSVAFSPDGRTLASGNWGYGIRLLDVTTGFLQHALDDTSVVRDVAFSPDGRTLASVGEDYTIRLWDADTGTLRHTLEGHTDRGIVRLMWNWELTKKGEAAQNEGP